MKLSELVSGLLSASSVTTSKLAALKAENEALKAQVADLQAQLVDPNVPQEAVDALAALEAATA